MGPRAPVGGRSLLRGGPTRPGHARRRPTAAAAAVLRWRRRYGDRWLGRACTRGAARRGKGGGARGCGCGGLERRGRGGGELGQPAMADARPGAEQSEEEQVRESAGEWGARRLALYRAGEAGRVAEEAGHAARKLGNGGHIHGHAASLRPSTEHVAGDGMTDVGSRFGPLPG